MNKLLNFVLKEAKFPSKEIYVLWPKYSQNSSNNNVHNNSKSYLTQIYPSTI